MSTFYVILLSEFNIYEYSLIISLLYVIINNNSHL